MSESEDRTVTVRRATIYALAIAIPLAAGAASAFFAIWHLEPIAAIVSAVPHLSVGGFLLVAGASVLVVWVTHCLHEPIHALTYRLLTRRPRDSGRFGRDTGLRYTYITEPVTPRVYRTQLAAPAVLLAALPLAISLATGNLALLVVGIANLGGAGTDLYQLWRLRDVPTTARIVDHPDKPGFFVIQ